MMGVAALGQWGVGADTTEAVASGGSILLAPLIAVVQAVIHLAVEVVLAVKMEAVKMEVAVTAALYQVVAASGVMGFR